MGGDSPTTPSGGKLRAHPGGRGRRGGGAPGVFRNRTWGVDESGGGAAAGGGAGGKWPTVGVGEKKEKLTGEKKEKRPRVSL